MNFPEALAYFDDRSDYDQGFVSNPFAGDDAAVAGLERTRRVLEELDRPDRAYPIVHVAGTKGKGSTCAFIESVSRRAGRKTGMFVTPHLHSVLERVQIDAAPVAPAAWADAMTTVAEVVGHVESRYRDLGRVTAFEINTALSLLVFARSKVEIGVVEVGLGGRLDATNVVNPAVSVITPISMDHQAILGNTLGEIAAEKAGIIKQSTPVVVASQTSEAFSVIEERARNVNAELNSDGVEWTAAYTDGATTLAGPWGELPPIALGLRGRHQAANAGAALMALWLCDRNLFDDLEAIAAGLQSVRWPGRFETVNDGPLVIADGAHNDASIAALMRSVEDIYPDRDAIVVFGSYTDKDLPGMLAELQSHIALVIATRSESPRSRPTQEIRRVATELKIPCVEQGSVAGAIRLAMDLAEEDSIIIATGSLSVVAETREYFGLGKTPPSEREIIGR